MTAPIIAYYRVSTDKQGKSGHGLEAQRATVESFAKSHNWPIIAEFTEIETGKRSDRPQLNAAKGLQEAEGAAGHREAGSPVPQAIVHYHAD